MMFKKIYWISKKISILETAIYRTENKARLTQKLLKTHTILTAFAKQENVNLKILTLPKNMPI